MLAPESKIALTIAGAIAIIFCVCWVCWSNYEDLEDWWYEVIARRRNRLPHMRKEFSNIAMDQYTEDNESYR